MEFSKGMFAIAAIVLSIAGLSGCASNLVEVRLGSDRVSQADASQVANCQPKGKINVSVLAKIGFISRSAEAVQANLLQLARNGAVDAGGDTVVHDSTPDFGRSNFSIYKCRP